MVLSKGQSKRIGNILTKWTKEVTNTYKDKLKKEGIRSTGELIDLMSYGVRKDGYVYEAFLNLMDYWKYIEDGRLSGSWPPVDSILNWIRQKPIIPQPFTLPNGQQRIPTENQLAFLIGRKIYQDGIPPNPLLLETIQQLREGLISKLREAIGEELQEELLIEFKS